MSARPPSRPPEVEVLGKGTWAVEDRNCSDYRNAYRSYSTTRTSSQSKRPSFLEAFGSPSPAMQPTTRKLSRSHSKRSTGTGEGGANMPCMSINDLTMRFIRDGRPELRHKWRRHARQASRCHLSSSFKSSLRSGTRQHGQESKTL